VSSGLKAGDEVVTEGLDKLRDGMKVDPQQPGAKLVASVRPAMAQKSKAK
jgi:hypothetical protein